MNKISIIILVIIGLGIGVYVFINSNNSLIPDNYNLKLIDDYKMVDGPSTTYYIYDNKIIVEKITYYPLGSPYHKTRTIELFEKVNTSTIKNVQNIPNLENGKILLNENE